MLLVVNHFNTTYHDILKHFGLCHQIYFEKLVYVKTREYDHAFFPGLIVPLSLIMLSYILLIRRLKVSSRIFRFSRTLYDVLRHFTTSERQILDLTFVFHIIVVILVFK